MKAAYVIGLVLVALMIVVVAFAVGAWIRRDDARADAARRRPGGGAE